MRGLKYGYLGEFEIEPRLLLTIAPTYSSGGVAPGGGSTAKILIFYRANGPHSRLLSFLSNRIGRQVTSTMYTSPP